MAMLKHILETVLTVMAVVLMTLVGSSTVGAQASGADGFYVIPCMRGNYAPVPKTGQTVTQGTRDDGALQKGVAWATPRFTDNNNGTVTDNLTKLIWLKNANFIGLRTWTQALNDAKGLQSGMAGLTDGSQAGDWRLPNVRELQSLVDYGSFNPTLPAVNPFTGVVSSYYWMSTTDASYLTNAWGMSFYGGMVGSNDKTGDGYVWCVRGGP